MIIRNPKDCETESWRDEQRGHVDWWTLFSSDRTDTRNLTVGLAEVPVGAPRPARGHRHSHDEVYYFVAGSGEVVVDGKVASVTTGDAVFIPGHAEHMAVNTGSEPLKLLYVFAADSFEDIVYEFPGDI